MLASAHTKLLFRFLIMKHFFFPKSKPKLSNLNERGKILIDISKFSPKTKSGYTHFKISLIFCCVYDLHSQIHTNFKISKPQFILFPLNGAKFLLRYFEIVVYLRMQIMTIKKDE